MSCWQFSIGNISGKRKSISEDTQIAKKLKITTIWDKLLEYKRNWIQHVNRMPCNRLPRIMKNYSPTGRKNHGRPLKRLLDTWDRNGSTSGPTPWQIDNDDNDDDDDDDNDDDDLKTEMYAKCNKIQFLLPAFPHRLKQLVKTTKNSQHTKAQSTLNRVKGNTSTSSQ
jgi:hypothetical protein